MIPLSLLVSPYSNDISSRYDIKTSEFSKKCSDLFDIAELINRREYLIAQAESMLDGGFGVNTTWNDVLASLRMISLAIVEQLAAKFGLDGIYQVMIRATRNTTAIEYAHKMTSDCDEAIAYCVSHQQIDPSVSVTRNPFVLVGSIDEIKQMTSFTDDVQSDVDIQRSLEFLRFRRACDFLVEVTAKYPMPIITERTVTASRPTSSDSVYETITTRIPNPPIRVHDIRQLLASPKLPKPIISLFAVSRCLIELCEQLADNPNDVSCRQLKRFASSQSVHNLTYKGDAELFVYKLTDTMCNLEKDSLINVAAAGGLPMPLLIEINTILDSCYIFMMSTSSSNSNIKGHKSSSSSSSSMSLLDKGMDKLLREISPSCSLFLNWLRGIMNFLLSASRNEGQVLDQQHLQVQGEIDSMMMTSDGFQSDQRQNHHHQQVSGQPMSPQPPTMPTTSPTVMSSSLPTIPTTAIRTEERKQQEYLPASPIKRKKKKTTISSPVAVKPVPQSPQQVQQSDEHVLALLKNHATAQAYLESKVQSLTTALVGCGIVSSDTYKNDDGDDGGGNSANKRGGRPQVSLVSSKMDVTSNTHLYNRVKNPNKTTTSTTSSLVPRMFVVLKVKTDKPIVSMRIDGSDDDWQIIIGIDSLSGNVGIIARNVTAVANDKKDDDDDHDVAAAFVQIQSSGIMDASLFASSSSSSFRTLIIPSLFASQLTDRTSLDLIPSSSKSNQATTRRRVGRNESSCVSESDVIDYCGKIIASLTVSSDIPSSIGVLRCRFSRLILSKDISACITIIKKEQLDYKLATGQGNEIDAEVSLKDDLKSKYNSLVARMLTNHNKSEAAANDDSTTDGSMNLEVKIYRNVTNDGFEIRCQPKSSLSSGLLNMHVYDDEMEIIMLNTQAGLWSLSKHRWNCMVEICNIIITRLMVFMIKQAESCQLFLSMDRTLSISPELIHVWTRVINELSPEVMTPSRAALTKYKRLLNVAMAVHSKMTMLKSGSFESMDLEVKAFARHLRPFVPKQQQQQVEVSIVDSLTSDVVIDGNVGSVIDVALSVNCNQFKNGILTEIKVIDSWVDVACRKFLIKFIDFIISRISTNSLTDADMTLFDIDIDNDFEESMGNQEEEELRRQDYEKDKQEAKLDISRIVIQIISLVYLELPCHVTKLSEKLSIEDQLVAVSSIDHPHEEEASRLDMMTKFKTYINHAEMLAFLGCSEPDKNSNSMSYYREQFRHRFHSLLDIDATLTDEAKNSLTAFLLSRLIVGRASLEAANHITCDVNRFLHYSSESSGSAVLQLSFACLGRDVVISAEPSAKSALASTSGIVSSFSKVVSQEELYQLMYGRHGEFPEIALNWRRRQAACRFLGKEMKIINSPGVATSISNRLETTLHANTFIIQVNIQKPLHDSNSNEASHKPKVRGAVKKKTRSIELGGVEIDEFTTLRELRIMITKQFGLLQNEEDSDDESIKKPPRHYAFISKKHQCSNRQEYSRLAKDEMPTISLVKSEGESKSSQYMEDYESLMLLDAMEDRRLLRESSLKSHNDRLDWVKEEIGKRTVVTQDNTGPTKSSSDISIPVVSARETDQLTGLLNEGWDEQVSSFYFAMPAIAWVRHLCPFIWCKSDYGCLSDELPVLTSEVPVTNNDDDDNLIKNLSYLNVSADGPVYVRVGKPSLWPNYAAAARALESRADKKKQRTSSRMAKNSAQTYQQGKVAYLVTKNNVCEVMKLLYPPQVEEVKMNDEPDGHDRPITPTPESKTCKYDAWRNELTSSQVWNMFSFCIVLTQPLYLPKMGEEESNAASEAASKARQAQSAACGIASTANSRTRQWSLKNAIAKPVFDPRLIADSSWWTWRPECDYKRAFLNLDSDNIDGLFVTQWNDCFVNITACVNKKYDREKCSGFIENSVPEEDQEMNYRMSWRVQFDTCDVNWGERMLIPQGLTQHKDTSGGISQRLTATSQASPSLSGLFSSDANKRNSKKRSVAAEKLSETESKKKKMLSIARVQKLVEDRKLAKLAIHQCCICCNYFRVSIPKFIIEKLIVDVPFSERSDYFMKSSSLSEVICIIFETACSSIEPVTSTLTDEKFFIIVRESKMFENLRPREEEASPPTTTTTIDTATTAPATDSKDEAPSNEPVIGEFDRKIQEVVSSLFKREIDAGKNVVRGRTVTPRGFFNLLSKLSMMLMCPDVQFQDDEEDVEVASPELIRPNSRGGSVTDFIPLVDDSILSENVFSCDDMSYSSMGTLESVSQKEMRRIKRFALSKLVWCYIASIPGEISLRLWKMAKDKAIEFEGKRQCATIRIQSCCRMITQKLIFTRHIQSAIIIEAYFRFLLAKRRVRLWKMQIEADRLFRRRYWGAMRMQALARMFVRRKKYCRKRREIRELEVEHYKIVRQKGKETKTLLAKRTIFRAITRIASDFVSVTLRIADKSLNADSNGQSSSQISLASVLSIYVASSQKKASYDITDSQYREFMAVAIVSNMLSTGEGSVVTLEKRSLMNIILESKGTCLSYAELLNPEYISIMINQRLINRQRTSSGKANDSEILLCRRSAGYSGKKIARRVVSISGGDLIYQTKRNDGKSAPDSFVVTVYAGSSSISVHAYHPRSCIDFSTNIDINSLSDFLAVEKLIKNTEQHKDSPLQSKLDAFLESDINASCNKLIEKLVLRRRGTGQLDPFKQRSSLDFELLCGLQVNRNIEHEATVMIQMATRRYISACHLCKLMQKRHVKVWDYNSRKFYYLDAVTQTSHWSRDHSYLLLRHDVPDPVEDKWVSLSTDGKEYYVNPYRGVYSNLSEAGAACAVQKLIRRRLEKLMFPCKLCDKIRAIVIESSVESAYSQAMRESRVNPSQPVPKLSAVLNYALFQQLIKFDFSLAAESFKLCLTISPNNPIVLRSYAIFLLSSSIEHRKAAVTKSLELLHQAHILDRFGEKFLTAFKLFYQYICFKNRNDHRGLLALALCYQCVWNRYEVADYIYRRALRISPHDECLVTNFQEFEANRLPDGLYAGGGPGCDVAARSAVEKTSPDWGEWETRLNGESKQQMFKRFWFNKLTELTQWREPDWKEQSRIRLGRSLVVDMKGNWQVMQDMRISQMDGRNEGLFYYNHAVDEVSFSKPPML